MAGFIAPNYTQVPNDFFQMAADMGEAELKVVLYIIRETFGYHRETCDVSIRKLALGAGLTPRNAYNGAEKAISRGLIVKTVCPGNITKWRAVVGEDTVLYPLRQRTVSPRKVQVPVKEIKETKQNDDDEVLATISKAYQSEIGILTPMIADELREASAAYPVQWTLDAIREAATQNKRGWKYVLAILTRWKAQGNQNPMEKPQTGGNYKPRDLIKERYGGIMDWLKEAEENDNNATNGDVDGANRGCVPELEAGQNDHPIVLRVSPGL